MVTLPDTFFPCAFTTIRKKINSILFPCGSSVILFIIFVLLYTCNFLVSYCYHLNLENGPCFKKVVEKLILISIIYSMMEDNKTCSKTIFWHYIDLGMETKNESEIKPYWNTSVNFFRKFILRNKINVE